MKSIESVITQLVEKTLATRAKSDWDSSPYLPLLGLQPDLRGQVGEEICVSILRSAGHVVEFDSNVTQNEKDYDFICDGLRIEVKLATRGRQNKTFQHESLNRQRHFDGLVILDIAPDKVYALCEAKADLPWSNMHRRHSSSYYKFDLSVAKHEKAQREVKTVDDFLKRYRAMDRRIRKLRKS